jgi:hypothetical protein
MYSGHGPVDCEKNIFQDRWRPSVNSHLTDLFRSENSWENFTRICVECMGCDNSKMEARDSERDPRWDVEGFSRWAEACQLAWVRVGYLRELKELGKPIPYQQLAPKGSLWIGVPPPDVQLYAISPYTWLGKNGPREEWLRQPTDNEQMHCDPDGFLLQHMVKYLNQDGALDDDLTLMHHISAMCFTPTEREVALRKRQKRGAPARVRSAAL